jgi:type IV secretory pathway protease TraF
MVITLSSHPHRNGRRNAAIQTAFWALVAVSKPVLLLNRSPSEPPGLYLRNGLRLRPGEIIAFRTPAAAFPYADLSMAYLRHRPLLKAIAAVPGDAVCTREASW